MKTRDIEELLITHADGLASGREIDEPPTEASEGVEPLLDVAIRVHHRLTPVEPRPDFVTNLWARLQPSDVIIPVSAPRPKMWLWIVAGVGGLISLASLFVIVVRLVITVFRRVSGQFRAPSPGVSGKARATT